MLIKVWVKWLWYRKRQWQRQIKIRNNKIYIASDVVGTVQLLGILDRLENHKLRMGIDVTNDDDDDDWRSKTLKHTVIL